jgi:CRISPR-associated protein Cmr2
MMPRYLVNIAVGPVQEFIASARRLRDLWYGSYLLSELSKAVARSLHDQGCDLVFPAVSTKDDLDAGSSLNVANKIMALTPDQADPAAVVSRARQEFHAHWLQISEEALTKARQVLGGSAVQEDLFRKQIEDAGEFFAAWVEYEPERYQECRDRCERRLAGRKTLREFRAPTWDGTGKPKSSLDGIRESVLASQGRSSYIVKKGEQLDSLAIVKRFGPLSKVGRPHFDSLAQVSALPLVEGLRIAAQHDPDIAGIVQQLPAVDALYPDNNDRPPGGPVSWLDWPQALSTELLFPSVLDAEIRDRKDEANLGDWKEAASLLRRLWRKTAEPSPYCCLMVGDGDNMGKALNTIKTIEQHKQFSAELDRFARDVHSLLKQYQGQVIYSGGDDVMAYVPLHRALDCADAVNTAFADTMQRACAGTGISPVPTFSMGLVIVHQHKPLHEVLDLARSAEQYAKNEGGRSCLAVIQSKRSGSDITVSGKWSPDDPAASLAGRLRKYIDLYNRQKLSTRLGYQLRGVAVECGGTLQWDNNGGPDTITTAEAVRLIGRKKQQSGTKDADLDALDLLAGHRDLRAAADELVIANQISGADRLASGQQFGESAQQRGN